MLMRVDAFVLENVELVLHAAVALAALRVGQAGADGAARRLG